MKTCPSCGCRMRFSYRSSPFCPGNSCGSIPVEDVHEGDDDDITDVLASLPIPRQEFYA